MVSFSLRYFRLALVVVQVVVVEGGVLQPDSASHEMWERQRIRFDRWAEDVRCTQRGKDVMS